MKILIMCGGRGKRLGRLTDQTPKPLLKLDNKTILERKIQNYFRQGFKDFIICIGYKGELIRKSLAVYSPKVQFEFSDEGNEVGILDRLYRAKDLFEDQVLMTYGDTYTEIELARFIEMHQNSDNEATIVVAPIKNPFGLVEFDQNNKVTCFKEKPVLNYYIGYAIINKSAFNFIPSEVVCMPDGEGLVTFYKTLMTMQKLGVYYYTGIQITFNTHDEFRAAEEKLIRFYTAYEGIIE